MCIVGGTEGGDRGCGRGEGSELRYVISGWGARGRGYLAVCRGKYIRLTVVSYINCSEQFLD